LSSTKRSTGKGREENPNPAIASVTGAIKWRNNPEGCKENAKLESRQRMGVKNFHIRSLRGGGGSTRKKRKKKVTLRQKPTVLKEKQTQKCKTPNSQKNAMFIQIAQIPKKEAWQWDE